MVGGPDMRLGTALLLILAIIPKSDAMVVGMTGMKMRGPGATEADTNGAPLMPWQRTNLPVYSVSSQGKDGKSKTMNIATYVNIASVPRPGKAPMYTVALFKTSLSYKNVRDTGRMLLQLLGEEHACLVDLLGKTSGRDGNKVALLEDITHQETQLLNGLLFIPSSRGVCELSVTEWMDAGDHEVALCRVESVVIGAPGPVLYTDHLRDKGILPHPVPPTLVPQTSVPPTPEPPTPEPPTPEPPTLQQRGEGRAMPKL